MERCYNTHPINTPYKIKEMPIESQLKIESRAQELIALELFRQNLKQLKH